MDKSYSQINEIRKITKVGRNGPNQIVVRKIPINHHNMKPKLQKSDDMIYMKALPGCEMFTEQHKSTTKKVEKYNTKLLRLKYPNIICAHSCYCRQYNSAGFFFFLLVCSPLFDPFFIDDQTHFGPYYESLGLVMVKQYPFQAQNVQNVTQSVYGQHQGVSWHLQAHLGCAKGQSRKKLGNLLFEIITMCTYIMLGLQILQLFSVSVFCIMVMM